MSDFDIQTPAFDPFADANAENSGVGSKDYVHVRVQQRNGRKSLTTVHGLNKEFRYNKILKDLKKQFCCNGNVVQDPKLGQVIQLQGDQRKNVSSFLIQNQTDVIDVCMDESAVSSDPVIAFLLDEKVVNDWCWRTFKNILTEMQVIYNIHNITFALFYSLHSNHVLLMAPQI